jgi:hypothetical protein
METMGIEMEDAVLLKLVSSLVKLTDGIVIETEDVVRMVIDVMLVVIELSGLPIVGTLMDRLDRLIPFRLEKPRFDRVVVKGGSGTEMLVLRSATLVVLRVPRLLAETDRVFVVRPVGTSVTEVRLDPVMLVPVGTVTLRLPVRPL